MMTSQKTKFLIGDEDKVLFTQKNFIKFIVLWALLSSIVALNFALFTSEPWFRPKAFLAFGILSLFIVIYNEKRK